MPKNEDVGPIAGWDGFFDPNYTPIPDDFFDVLLAQLTDVEVRVLLYIMRRTYGFKKRSDTISLSQLTDGIVTRDGERLDRGAGVSKNGANIAIGRLEARGIVIAERRRGPDRAHLPTLYRLRMHGQPLSPVGTRVVPDGDKGSTGAVQALVPPRDIQETVVTINREQEVRESALTNAVDRTAVTDQPATNDPPYSAWLAAIILDYSNEMGSKANTAANVDRALRLWQTSGLDEAAFVELLRRAKLETRQAQARGIANKMERLFSELEKMLR